MTNVQKENGLQHITECNTLLCPVIYCAKCNYVHRYALMICSILSKASLEITHNYVQHYTPMICSVLSTVSLEITHNYVHCYTHMIWFSLSTVSLEIKHKYVHRLLWIE
jgi:hypothetical protein